MGLFFIIPLYFVKNSGAIPLYFIIFVVIIPLYFVKNRGAIPFLFYQKVVSLHIDVLSFFSDLNKIIELCIYNER